MLKSFKTEINPTLEQKQKIICTIGVCRFVYNFYLVYNKDVYEKEKRFMSGMEFSKWLNNEFVPNNPEFVWIKEVCSKSVKQSIMNAERAFKNFFKGKTNFPRFKKKSRSDVKMYFVKTDCKTIISCERHRIKIPTLGWVRIKEKGYIPTTKNGYTIKSGTVSIKAGRFYISVLAEIPDTVTSGSFTDGIGIDLGIKDFAIVSNGQIYKNINKTPKVKKLEKKLKREQRKLSRKYENFKKGETIQKANIQKQKVKLQKLHYRLDNIRTDYINKIIAETAKIKPSYITIEDLNVKGMMKNRHLSKAIAPQKFYEFRMKLQEKCKENGIELRIADRFYPSSKTCHNCGCVKSDLKLSDRTFHCEGCGYTADRDYNASLNLKDCQTYVVAQSS